MNQEDCLSSDMEAGRRPRQESQVMLRSLAVPVDWIMEKSAAYTDKTQDDHFQVEVRVSVSMVSLT